MKLCAILLAICFAAAIMADGGRAAALQPAKFKITTRKTDDVVEAQADKDKVVFVVKSPFGISQASIERQDNDWPKTVTLKLHLKGLDKFRASNGTVVLDAAVSIQDGKPRIQLTKDKMALDDKSPLWIDIRVLSDDGKAARELPLKNGYFELTLPKAFFEGNPKSITVEWIDFYR
jgi:hypothetical protein